MPMNLQCIVAVSYIKERVEYVLKLILKTEHHFIWGTGIFRLIYQNISVISIIINVSCCYNRTGELKVRCKEGSSNYNLQWIYFCKERSNLAYCWYSGWNVRAVRPTGPTKCRLKATGPTKCRFKAPRPHKVFVQIY